MNDATTIAVLHHGKIEYLPASGFFLATSSHQPEPIQFQRATDALKWLDGLEEWLGHDFSLLVQTTRGKK